MVKNKTDGSEKPSRRKFAKTVAAALVAAPLSSSLVDAQNRRGQPRRTRQSSQREQTFNEREMPRPLESPQTPCPTPRVIGILVDEPPIVIGGSSFSAESSLELRHSTNSNPHRPHRYTKGGLHNGSITNVQVIKVERGLFDYTIYYPRLNSQLQLWFQKLGSDGQYVVADIERPEPDVVISGTPFRLDTESRLRELRHNKPSRERRYERQFPPGVDHFRIGRWRIIDSTGVQWDKRGEDVRLFMITLCHTTGPC